MRAKTPFFNPNKKAPRTVGVVRSAKGSLIPVWIDNWDFYVEVQPYRFHGTVSPLLVFEEASTVQSVYLAWHLKKSSALNSTDKYY